MNNLTKHIKPYSRAIIKLLKSPIEKKNKMWNDVVHYQNEIQDYISVIGLELIIKKDEGFAFLKQYEDGEGNTLGLISRRQVGFEVSILLVILRQILEEFDSNPNQFQATEKFITGEEIKEEVELFLPEKYNRVQFVKELNSYIRRVVDLGYLIVEKKSEDGILYKIHRIIKEKVTLDILKEFKLKLEQHVESV